MTTSPKGSYVGLQDKVVLITGASSGIGAGAAEVFAAHGSSLVLCGRKVQNLQETAEKCEQLGLSKDKILQAPGDVTKSKDLQAALQAALDKFGRLDIVVANAGIVVPGNMEAITMEQYDLQMNVNLRSVFELAKLALPKLRKTKGNFIAISSIASSRPYDQCPAYCMSKAGMDQLIQCLAVEQAPNGVRVNCVNPGMIYTQIFKSSQIFGDEQAGSYEMVNAFASKTHPLGRCGNIYETGKAIAFLASDDASFITGVTLRVDGGAFLAGPNIEAAFKQ